MLRIRRRDTSFGWNRSLKKSSCRGSSKFFVGVVGVGDSIVFVYGLDLAASVARVDWKRLDIYEGSCPRAISRWKNFFVMESKSRFDVF